MVQNGDEYIVTAIDTDVKTMRSEAIPGVDIPYVNVTVETKNGSSVGGTMRLLVDYSDETIGAIQDAIISKRAEVRELAKADPEFSRRINAAFYNALSNDFITIKDIGNPFSKGG